MALPHLIAGLDGKGAVVRVVGAGGCEERTGDAGADAAEDGAAGGVVGKARAASGEAQRGLGIGKAQD